MLRFLAALAFAYVVVCALMWAFQERLVFLSGVGGRELIADPSALDLAFDDVTFEAADGVALHGWYVHGDDDAPVVIVFHGNAGNISHRMDTIRIFSELGLRVFIFDYRGYGRSEGRPTEAGTYRDAEAAWRWVTEERGVEPDDIVLFGRSLGGAVAAWLAAGHTPGALLLESTFTSLPELGASVYPIFPVRLLARLDYDVVDALSRVSAPVLVLHSPDDEIVPFSHGEALYEAVPGEREFFRMRGGHNDGFLASGADYRRAISGFIATHVIDGS